GSRGPDHLISSPATAFPYGGPMRPEGYLPAAPPFPQREPRVNFSGLIHNLGPLTITGLAQGAIYALFALGYTLVYGVLRLINFAHSEVFMVGTFAALYTWQYGFGLDQNSKTPSTGAVIAYMLIG